MKLSHNLSHSDTTKSPPTELTGECWAIPELNTDLSGRWKIVVTKNFKKEYDNYLAHLSQLAIVRSVAVNIADRTLEGIEQRDGGREFSIRGEISGASGIVRLFSPERTLWTTERL